MPDIPSLATSLIAFSGVMRRILTDAPWYRDRNCWKRVGPACAIVLWKQSSIPVYFETPFWLCRRVLTRSSGNTHDTPTIPETSIRRDSCAWLTGDSSIQDFGQQLYTRFGNNRRPNKTELVDVHCPWKNPYNYNRKPLQRKNSKLLKNTIYSISWSIISNFCTVLQALLHNFHLVSAL